MHVVDLNCDMGESFGPYQLGQDEEILRYITSANIACGFHAGDPATMRKTVQLALKHKVGIGAHPGLQDLSGFGRREMNISPKEAYELVVYQIGALSAFVKAEGGKLQHVKPHGALFNMASRDSTLAKAIAEAVYHIDPEFILFGLSSSELIKAGRKIGLRTANEVFSDRTYQEDGTLTSRHEPNAHIPTATAAVNQVIKMVKEGKASTVQGSEIAIEANTVCIHGDGENAAEYAQSISSGLQRAGISLKKIGDILI